MVDGCKFRSCALRALRAFRPMVEPDVPMEDPPLPLEQPQFIVGGHEPAGPVPDPVVGVAPPGVGVAPQGQTPAAPADPLALVQAILGNPAAVALLQQLTSASATPAAAGPSRVASRTAHQPAEFSGKGSTGFDQYKKSLLPYLCAANEPPERWGQVAVTFLAQGSPAFEHFHRVVEHHGIDFTDVSQLTWNVFDSIMGSGTFGVPPTDRSVRRKLQVFKQRMPLDTASFMNAFLDLCAKAPTPIDSHTKIHFFLEAAHSMLADKYELPPDGGVWRDWEHLYGVVSVNAALYDRQVTHMISQQRVTDALAKTHLSDRPLTYAAAAAGAADKFSGYQGYGKQQRDRGQYTRPGQPYPRPPPRYPGTGQTAKDKYGHKESYVPGLSKEQVAHNAANNICHKCGKKAETAYGKFDVAHRRQCTGKPKRDVSG